ncbi:TrmH family RNA methyltransferase [Ponticaulis profundi]|uniref:TrmH family RNA methyltransferase n=1 Tax=Ponticaulis profundi TaxID=2665222 RepID=A0ABW1S5K7_9PROT
MNDDSDAKKSRKSLRSRVKELKPFQCKNLIAVLEEPNDIGNIGTVIRNVNASGVEKVYIIDPQGALPDEWQEMRETRALSKTSGSANKWTFVKRFDSTQDCLDHLRSNGYKSVATSPHVKGKASYYLDECDFTEMAKLAVWFGNEARGISEAAVQQSEFCVAIPMFGLVESLNLGTSSGIVLYEVTKQRRAYQSEYARSNRRQKRSVPLPTTIPRD